ncbi:hypothetical protein R1flu_014676 [Riccia fluitans]|uniref:Uncharacterized protein n=1 Tax=Riccia fluitans TaxID=41844 RepID=A0ABD1YH39_9MARC
MRGRFREGTFTRYTRSIDGQKIQTSRADTDVEQPHSHTREVEASRAWQNRGMWQNLRSGAVRKSSINGRQRAINERTERGRADT